MLALIFTHGHLVSLVQQNIGCHQHGICKNSNANAVFAYFARFIFKLCHPTRFAKAGKAFHDPTQLIVFDHVRLQKERAVLGVDAKRQQLSDRSKRVLAELFGIWRRGQRMQIDDAIKGIMALL